MINQLQPPIWVKTKLGTGLAIMVIDYGIHLNTCWVVALEDKDWQVKHFDSNDIKLERNSTYKIG